MEQEVALAALPRRVRPRDRVEADDALIHRIHSAVGWGRARGTTTDSNDGSGNFRGIQLSLSLPRYRQLQLL